MSLRIYHVDAFTDRRFAGNPAAVCVLADPADESWMQQLAAEMNLSETAYVRPLGTDSRFNLRWFTPRVEVDLCGHATLATAHVLWEEGYLSKSAAALFETKGGLLKAQPDSQGIALDFPAEPIQNELSDERALNLLRSAIHAPIRFAGRNRLDILVELESESAVRAVKPDIRSLAELPVRGVILTGRSDSRECDFVSRFFAPRVGVDEDPVCGSAHCCLGPYWAARLGKRELLAHQVSCRGGVIGVRVDDARIALIGKAVTVLRGELL
jgi:PhzF family phenazine biosynthesis protein